MEEKEILIAFIDATLDRIEEIDKEREALLVSLKEKFPIKEGEKVEIRNSQDKDNIVRYAFVEKISVYLRGREKKAKIEFNLQVCKKDGTKGQHSDYLKVAEYITKKNIEVHVKKETSNDRWAKNGAFDDKPNPDNT